MLTACLSGLCPVQQITQIGTHASEPLRLLEVIICLV